MQNIKQFLVLIIFITGFISACDKPKQAETESSAQTQNKTEIVPTANPKIETPVKVNDAEVINFAGFGPAKFGDNEESVRMSWGHPLEAGKPAVGATCYYLTIDPKPEDRRGITFMFEDAKFVRYDVDDPKWVAPGNIVVGDKLTDVLQAHAGHVDNQPHKYIEGAHTLVVTPTKTATENKPSSARLIFETDANNIIINWRIGVSPQVYYVEGCS